MWIIIFELAVVGVLLGIVWLATRSPAEIPPEEPTSPSDPKLDSQHARLISSAPPASQEHSRE